MALLLAIVITCAGLLAILPYMPNEQGKEDRYE